jgi:hypothetical protein
MTLRKVQDSLANLSRAVENVERALTLPVDGSSSSKVPSNVTKSQSS